MFDDTKLDRVLTRQDLDAVSTQHPIVVNHRGGHTSWYNTTALQLADINRSTPDPTNGRFFRDASGELTGRVAEQARGGFGRVGRREQFTQDQQRDRSRRGMRHISELLTAAGLTTVHDAGAGADSIRTYEDVYRQGELRHRAYLMIRGAYEQLRNAGVYTGFGDDWVRIGGVKYAADGSASERTMRMITPYVGTSDYGILTMTQEEIHQRVEDAHRAKRIKATGSIPTPFWTYVYYHGEKWSEYGNDKMQWMFAHRSFLDAGITVPGASDYGPGPFEPLMAIQSMVTRKDYRGREWGANQKVSVDEALEIATINGAYASYEERTKGSITPGKLADFVMLEKDPHQVPPDEIMTIKIARTVVGGRTMYPKE